MFTLYRIGTMLISLFLAPLVYTVDVGNPSDGLVHFSVEAPQAGRNPTFSVPVWTPGHYKADMPVATIQDVAAFDGDGNLLPVQKTGLSEWTVSSRRGSVTLSYKAHLAKPGPTGSELTPDHLYFHPTDFFPILNDDLDQSSRILLAGLPNDWRVATALKRCADGEGWCAPNAHRLYDSPFEISDYQELTYESGGATFHIIISGNGGPYDLEVFPFVEDFKRFTDAQIEVFDGIAPGGISDYWWLLFPGGGGGLEHRDSTTIYFNKRVFEGNRGSYDSLVSVSSHELFHAWNVKRIRPAVMVPYSYTEPPPTSLLWVSEGITSYYGRLARVRGGNMTVKEYFEGLAGVINAVANSLGYPQTSAALSSYDTWIGQGTASEQRSISYYTTGEMLGFFMEAKLREESGGIVSLDDLMTYLYQTKWNEDRGPGFTEEDLLVWLERSTEGDNGWDAFFDQWVRGSDDLPLEAWPWSLVGMEATGTEQPSLGMEVRGSWPLTVSHIYPQEAASEAGFFTGDEILLIGDEKATLANLKSLEEPTEVSFLRHDRLLKTVYLPGVRTNWKVSLSLPQEEDESLAWTQDWLAIPPPVMEPVQEDVESELEDIYDESAIAEEDISTALEMANTENRRVLLVYGGNWCGWCHALHRLFASNTGIRKKLQYEYEVVMVDIGNFDKNMEIAQRFGADLKKTGVPFLTVLDRDGNLVVNQETGSLEEGNSHSPDAVMAFLTAWQATPLRADSVLISGLSMAREKERLVFLHTGAPWCGWCKRLESFLLRPDIAPIMERAFVDVKIDVDRMEGGAELSASLRESEKGGIPWIAILSADGEVLIHSDEASEGNIGFPVADHEIAFFMRMLALSPLSDEDLSFIETALNESATKILG